MLLSEAHLSKSNIFQLQLTILHLPRNRQRMCFKQEQSKSLTEQSPEQKALFPELVQAAILARLSSEKGKRRKLSA